VDEAFNSVAELAYEHHVKVTQDVLRLNQMGEAVNLNALRSSNFKLNSSGARADAQP
jgi:hypothetical protein